MSHGHAGNDITGRTQGCGSPSTDNDNFQTPYKARNTMATQRTGIADIPVELLIDNILPFCEAKDVLSLGCTNKFLALVTTDDMLWKRKLAVDYNFTGSETARTSGWKFIYQRLRNPRVFVWGCVIFSVLFYVTRVLIRPSTHPAYSSHCKHSERGLTADLDCQSFQARPSRMFLFRSNFTSQVFAWSAWQRVECQYESRSSDTPHILLISVCLQGFPHA